MRAVIKKSNCWHTWATLERCVTLAPVFAGMLIIGLVGRAPAFTTENRLNKNICLSDECQQTALAVLSKMNTRIDGCSDFYKFSCENFINKTHIPDDQISLDTFSAISNKIRAQLRSIITEERPKSDPKSLRLPNALYKACMNESLLKTLGNTPITQLSDSMGGWPVVVGSSWDTNNTWSWQETIKKFKQIGFWTNYIINVLVDVDVRNNTKHIIKLRYPVTGLEPEYLIEGFKNQFVSNYYDYMVDIAVTVGADKQAAKNELRGSLQFEIDLANISLSSTDLNKVYSINRLQELYPFAQWLDYINALLPVGHKVNKTENVSVVAPSLLKNLGKLLQSTSKRSIANYLMWRIHELSTGFLSEKFRQKQFQFDYFRSGLKKQAPRAQQCVNIVTSCLPVSVNSLYVRKHFQQESKAIAVKMINNIRRVFSKLLDEASWMDEETKQEAKKKLKKMAVHVGYPDELFDVDKMEKLLDSFEIHPDKYFESFLKMNVIEQDYWNSKLREPVNNTDWVTHNYATKVNAYYSPIENSIAIPAGILQDTFFNAHRPMYMNYGAIGVVIGHEIVHAFDNQGQNFDANGNLNDWWHSATKTAFFKKAKCTIEQYSNYTDKLTGLKLNGIKTLGENIADNVGLKAAYLAYKQWVAENGEEPILPGLNYTARQMFWISATQTWCGKYRKEAHRLILTVDTHPTKEFRILGALKNMKDFSEDFQCLEGTQMNPKHKCEVL